MSLKDPIGAGAAASIDGAPASLDGAAAAAARLLARSSQPLIAGLGADIDGARAAIALAERVGGVIEHMHSAALLRDLNSMRETGVMLTDARRSAGARRRRAARGGRLDRNLAWSHRAAVAAAGEAGGRGRQAAHRLAGASHRRKNPRVRGRYPDLASGARRNARRQSCGAACACQKSPHRERSNRAIRVAFVRARLDRDALIKAARFGVAVWTAASSRALEIEMVNGLVRDLNETTRFSTLPLPPPDNGAGVLAACGWTTGFPMRTGFGAGAPLHDPWRFDAERLVASGETDCVLWISAFGAAPPEWPNAMTVIALCEPTARFAKDPNVRIAIGRPGVDHDAVMHSSDAGTLVAVTASARSAAPSVAQALERIAAGLGEANAPPC